MLAFAILVVGTLLIGLQSFKQHGGSRQRALVDTSSWLLIAVAGVAASHFWPRNDFVLIAALLVALVAATFLRKRLIRS
jgi:low temperature requirement protein LtrA